MAELPYVRFFMSDWLGGTRGMKAAEIGIYFTLLALMYERGEPLPEDNQRLARQCGSTPKTFSTTLQMLIDEGKIDRTKYGLWNKRVQNEFVFRAQKSQDNSRAAKIRWGKLNEINKETMQPHSECNADGMLARALVHIPESKTILTRANENEIRKAAGKCLNEAAPNLLVMSEPIRWINGGCDWDNDIIPAVAAVASKARNGAIKSWGYFTDAVFEARDRRLRPAPDPVTRPSKPNGKVGFGETAKAMIDARRNERSGSEVGELSDVQHSLPASKRL